MKIKIEASNEEKRAMTIVGICLLILVYILNRRYFYVLDAIFEGDDAKTIILKTGFIFPVKTEIPMKDGWEKKIRIYGNKIKVVKSGDNFIVNINGKKLTTIYPDSYYVKKMTSPTGRARL